MRTNKITTSILVVMIFGGVVVSGNADQSATLDNNLRREAIVSAVQMMVAEKTIPFDLQEQEEEEGVEQFHYYTKDMPLEDTQAPDAAGTADITSVTVGLNQPGVPCFEGCVQGALETAVGLPFPLKSFAVGDTVEYTVTVDASTIGDEIIGDLQKGLLYLTLVTDELEVLDSAALPIKLIPFTFGLAFFSFRTIPEFPEGVESANIAVLLVDSEFQPFDTYVALDAVRIRP